MAFDPQRHHRRSIRLPEHDYSEAGIYFFTSCTHQRECLFGDIVEGVMVLNKAGELAAEEWENLTVHFPTLTTDAFVVMPNHIHGIVSMNSSLSAGNSCTLGQVLRVYKSLTAISGNRLLDRVGQPLWQRNYYEHIIRTEQVLEKARRYILLNPERWEHDADNPFTSQSFGHKKRRGAACCALVVLLRPACCALIISQRGRSERRPYK